MSGRSVALVVEKNSDACFLLIIDKKYTVGDFSSLTLPRVGSVISMESSKSASDNTVKVSAWDNYTGYQPMGKFVGNDTGSAIEFTGMFYTTGCVTYCNVPLENPALFNNYVGIVIDKEKLLNENYIGKLNATVTLTKISDAYCWILRRVNAYFKMCANENLDDPEKRRGIVVAVNQGIEERSHYIMSRYFPFDVRFFSEPSADPLVLSALVGREVVFSARKIKAYYVDGEVTLAKRSDLRTVFRGGPHFSIEIIVEFIGCTDEQQRTIVWSNRLEVVLDKYNIFKDKDYGLYRIEAIRHRAANDFERWKVRKIIDVVKKYEDKQFRSSGGGPRLRMAPVLPLSDALQINVQ